jgi:hypothetical protein
MLQNLMKVHCIEQVFLGPNLSVLTKFHLINEQNILLHTNIADTYSIQQPKELNLRNWDSFMTQALVLEHVL